MSARLLSLCIVTAFGNRLGGSDNILWSFLRNVDRSRIEPEVIFLEGGSFVEEVAALGIKTMVLPAGRLRSPGHLVATAARISRLLRSSRPDLILNWLSTAHVYGGLGAWMAGMSDRCLWWQLDMHIGGRLSRGRLLDQLACTVPSTAIGACSEAAATHQRKLRPTRPTFAVLPGIPEPTPVSSDELEAWRRQLRLEPTLPVVGTIGRLFPWKGHHRLLEALAILNRAGIECQGLVVGGGGHRGDAVYETKLHGMVDELDLNEKLAFTGQVKDAARYLGLMDVFVNCSTPEPFGLVVIEAMATATATVAVDAGGPAEIIDAGVSGAFARSGTPADLAEAIRPLVEDAALRQRLGIEGRRTFEERFREERMAAEMADRLEGLAP